MNTTLPHTFTVKHVERIPHIEFRPFMDGARRMPNDTSRYRFEHDRSNGSSLIIRPGTYGPDGRLQSKPLTGLLVNQYT